MQIILTNGSSIDIELLSTPLSDLIEKWFRHLKNVDIPFRPWEYTGYVENRSIDDLIEDLVAYSIPVSVGIDRSRMCDQEYLNELHQIYENNYDGNQSWTDYHEHIHLIETKLRGKFPEHKLEINYRHLAGPLNRSFQQEWLSHGQTSLQAGDVYLAWDELGKTPYNYWHDNEPDEIQRLCQLAKPWLTIRPKIHVCLRDMDRDLGENISFENWWKSFEKEWCQHYGISSWSNRDSKTVIVIGKIQNHQNLEHLLDQKIWPRRIIL